MTLRAHKYKLDKQLQVLKETSLRKDLDIATLKGEVATATKVAAKDSKLIEVYRKQTGDAKKMNKHVSVDDQIWLDNTKRENQVKIVQEREMAKVNAREKQKERDEIRQNKKFSKSTDGYRRHKSGKWEIRSKQWDQRNVGLHVLLLISIF